jgi:hypothetical protein
MIEYVFDPPLGNAPTAFPRDYLGEAGLMLDVLPLTPKEKLDALSRLAVAQQLERLHELLRDGALEVVGHVVTEPAAEFGPAKEGG